MSTGVEERIYLWTRKNCKVTDLLDLNTYPEDGFLLGKDSEPRTSPCTYIPGQRRGRCTLNEMNVAGRVRFVPPTFSQFCDRCCCSFRY